MIDPILRPLVATLYPQSSSCPGLQIACLMCDVYPSPWVPHPLQSWSPAASLEKASAWHYYRRTSEEGLMASKDSCANRHMTPVLVAVGGRPSLPRAWMDSCHCSDPETLEETRLPDSGGQNARSSRHLACSLSCLLCLAWKLGLSPGVFDFHEADTLKKSQEPK